MKVAIKVTLDIDVDAWLAEYDVERSDVRRDVNEWAFHLIQQAAQDNGVINNPA